MNYVLDLVLAIKTTKSRIFSHPTLSILFIFDHPVILVVVSTTWITCGSGHAAPPRHTRGACCSRFPSQAELGLGVATGPCSHCARGPCCSCRDRRRSARKAPLLPLPGVPTTAPLLPPPARLTLHSSRRVHHPRLYPLLWQPPDACRS